MRDRTAPLHHAGGEALPPRASRRGRARQRALPRNARLLTGLGHIDEGVSEASILKPGRCGAAASRSTAVNAHTCCPPVPPPVCTESHAKPRASLCVVSRTQRMRRTRVQSPARTRTPWSARSYHRYCKLWIWMCPTRCTWCLFSCSQLYQLDSK